MKFLCEVLVRNQRIHYHTYNSLREICQDLNLTYYQVADISAKRRNKFDENKFKFAPKIIITKVRPNEGE